MTDRYVNSDADIEVALRYLKYHDPENATTEGAISLLNDLRAGFHGIAHRQPELLAELQKELDNNKRSQENIT